jgi:hypothetical protein
MGQIMRPIFFDYRPVGNNYHTNELSHATMPVGAADSLITPAHDDAFRPLHNRIKGVLKCQNLAGEECFIDLFAT